jgi:Tfp pilus assembly protein PilP
MTVSTRLIGSPVSLVVVTMLLVSSLLVCRPALAQAVDQAQALAAEPVPPLNAPAASDGAESDEDAVSSPQEPTGFTYNSLGRRDPFVSLVGQGVGGNVSARPAGLAGLGVAEVTLRGTLTSRDGFVAVLLGADQRTYIVRTGDALLDGVVQSISLDDMVILQEVNDPLSLETEREVRKLLRQFEAN